MKDSPVDQKLTRAVIDAFYSVYDDLGYGFLESVYTNALHGVLCDQGIPCRSEFPIEVVHRGRVVGFYRADLLVESCLILEIKSSAALAVTAERQLLNYLRATRIQVGLLLHFGPTPSFKRRVCTRQSPPLSAVARESPREPVRQAPREPVRQAPRDDPNQADPPQ